MTVTELQKYPKIHIEAQKISHSQRNLGPKEQSWKHNNNIDFKRHYRSTCSMYKVMA